MVRRRIEIKRIENKAKRYTTFSKRREGLFKKTMDLCKKIDGGVGAVIAITKAGNSFSMAHPHIDNVLSRYYAGLSREDSQENDVVGENDSSLLYQLTEETQKKVSEGMTRGQVESSLVDVGFAELEGLEKVFKSILADNEARRREAELNVGARHAD